MGTGNLQNVPHLISRSSSGNFRIKWITLPISCPFIRQPHAQSEQTNISAHKRDNTSLYKRRLLIWAWKTPLAKKESVTSFASLNVYDANFPPSHYAISEVGASTHMKGEHSRFFIGQSWIIQLINPVNFRRYMHCSSFLLCRVFLSTMAWMAFMVCF